ncbi:hypothetical protein AAMO2058_001728400 [Amorphochlora amoebiformis]
MPVDIRAFREDQGGDVKRVRESERKRGRDEKFVDEVLSADKQWREAVFQRENLQKKINSEGKKIGLLKREKRPVDKSLFQQMKKRVRELQADELKFRKSLNLSLSKVGNVLHESVPSGLKDVEVDSWGEMDAKLVQDTHTLRSHEELLAMIGGYNPVKGREVGGSRGYFLTGYAMLLNQALQMYAIRFLTQRKFTPVQPPVMIRQDVMAKVTQLSSFDEDLYKVTGGKEDMYLAATSEQPLCALHANEHIPEGRLPLLYCGVSTCFRKELTSHGIDAQGIFRVHNFEKVEQFAITAPGDSWRVQEKFLENAKHFYKSLGIPYRVVNIAAESLNLAAAKKYDLEGWFPSQGTCRELVSCSNCTDYQARALKCRFGYPKLGMSHTSKRGQMVHMVNSTLCASQRTLCCLLENHQTEAGIRVPEPLIVYVGTAFIPFKTLTQTLDAKNLKRKNRSTKKKRNAPSGPGPARVPPAERS